MKEYLYGAITETPPVPLTTEWHIKVNKAGAFNNLFIKDTQIIHIKILQIPVKLGTS